MDRFTLGKRGWINLGRGRDRQASSARRSARAALNLETLEGRIVLSTVAATAKTALPVHAAVSGSTGTSSTGSTGTSSTGSTGTSSTGATMTCPTGSMNGGPGGVASNSQGGPGGMSTQGGPGGGTSSQGGSSGGMGSQGGPSGGMGGPGGGMQQGPGGGMQGGSSVLAQDSMKVSQAFQTFAASIQSDVAALRQTATTSGGPSTDGTSAFNTAVESAVSTLNSSIGQDLSNLTNTGAALTSTIEGYTATLQSNIESAGDKGLANSTSSAVLALNKEIGGYEMTAQRQANQAIQNDVPSGTIGGTTAQTFNKAVASALQTFNQAITAAKQTATTNGTTLDSSAVSSAVSALSSSLTSAVSALPSGFSASSSNLTSSLTTELSTLQSDLTAIAAPTAGSTSSARTFSFAVSSALFKDTSAIVQTLNSAIDTYNQGLL